MRAPGAERIEIVVDAGAACVLAAATGLCALRLSLQLPVAGASTALAFCGALALLRFVRPEDRRFPIGHFEAVAPPVFDEDVQVDAFEDAPEVVGAADELLLDDVLAEISRDSRVVRLFDRTAMPTPGELQARIDRHLGSDRVSAAPPQAVQADASQALHEALAELRRSLR